VGLCHHHNPEEREWASEPLGDQLPRIEERQLVVEPLSPPFNKGAQLTH